MSNSNSEHAAAVKAAATILTRQCDEVRATIAAIPSELWRDVAVACGREMGAVLRAFVSMAPDAHEPEDLAQIIPTERAN